MDLKLSNHSTTAAMNGSIASANNATLATVAANYGLKTVVDQHFLDIAARITPLEVDTKVANALLRAVTAAALASELASRDASIAGLQASKADASALTAYALLSAVDTSSEVDSKIAAALLDARHHGSPGRRPRRQGGHVYCGYRNNRGTITYMVQWHLQRAQVLQLFGNDSSEGSNGLMALPAVMDLVADSQDEPGSGGSALFSDMSTPTRSWKQIAIHQESKQRESPPRRSSSSPATPRTSQKGVRSTSKGGRSKSPTSAEFRAAIKEKNKMEMEIGEYQKTLDEMSAAMANLHQEDYGSTIRIQELERRCEIASKQSGHLVSHHQHHMAEAWRKFEEEAQQMRKVEINAYQYGEKKDMESNVMMLQMRQAEGTITEQKREIAVMRSYMASEKSAAQESATHANQIHREASQQISVYQQQIRGIESSTSIEKFNEEEMVRSLKSQLEHALVKRPEVYSMEDSREQLMTRLNDVTAFAEQESKRAECLLREKEEIIKQYESDVSKKNQMIAIEGGHRQDAIGPGQRSKTRVWCTMDEKSKEAECWKMTAKGVYDEYLEEMRELQG